MLIKHHVYVNLLLSFAANVKGNYTVDINDKACSTSLMTAGVTQSITCQRQAQNTTSITIQRSGDNVSLSLCQVQAFGGERFCRKAGLHI